MRRRLAIAGLLLLCGCQKSFDDRYAEARKQIGDQAASIDRELAARASEAATGQGRGQGTATPGLTPGAPPPDRPDQPPKL
jgi:hypothetical protein